MHTRNAILPDVEHIHGIIEPYAQSGTLLPRTIAELCENVRDFVVAEDQGKIIGCGALHLYGQHLAEIRSIAVDPAAKKRGAGRALVEALLQEAERHNVSCVCLFTRIPGFFALMGFSVAQRQELPDKIYKDCLHCPSLYACDEIAMVRGPLPANLAAYRETHIPIPLVRLQV
ncbi:MAG TPA: N-acetyltransferase [Candidatus Angelobacter sp.]|nr:N-acetyltransferase [Candidatus Angelobacter sp.]